MQIEDPEHIQLIARVTSLRNGSKLEARQELARAKEAETKGKTNKAELIMMFRMLPASRDAAIKTVAIIRAELNAVMREAKEKARAEYWSQYSRE